MGVPQASAVFFKKMSRERTARRKRNGFAGIGKSQVEFTQVEINLVSS
jgi:hypothetical protein